MTEEEKEKIINLAEDWSQSSYCDGRAHNLDDPLKFYYEVKRHEKKFRDYVNNIDTTDQLGEAYQQTCANEGKLQDEVEVLRKALQLMHKDNQLIETCRDWGGDTDCNYWINEASESLPATPELMRQRTGYLLK